MRHSRSAGPRRGSSHRHDRDSPANSTIRAMSASTPRSVSDIDGPQSDHGAQQCAPWAFVSGWNPKVQIQEPPSGFQLSDLRWLATLDRLARRERQGNPPPDSHVTFNH